MITATSETKLSVSEPSSEHISFVIIDLNYEDTAITKQPQIDTNQFKRLKKKKTKNQG